MGQKVRPTGLRLGITEDWRSRWIAPKKEFGKLLVEDQKIRRYVKRGYYYTGISRIIIERTREQVRVILHVAKPGLIIGRRGSEVDKLKSELEELINRKVDIGIVEVRRPEMEAQLVAEAVAEQLERRASFRRTIRRAAEATMQAGAQGVKVNVAGRLGGTEIARSESVLEGSIPLHTLRADVDYGFAEARTTYGNIGVKCWIYKGRKLLKAFDG